MIHDVQRYGWHVVELRNSIGPSWSYTVGLWHTYRFPEVVIFGLPVDVRFDCLDSLVQGLRAGRRPVSRQLTTGLLEGAPTVLREVDPSWFHEMLELLEWASPSMPPVTQLVWPDGRDRFPWEGGFDPELHGWQPEMWLPFEPGWTPPPAPDQPARHPWPESHELRCITFPWVVEGRVPALYVSRHLDDVWQALDGAEVNDREDDAVVAPLGRLVDRDPSLLVLHDLPKGWEAWRDDGWSPWQRGPQADPN